MKVLVTGGAGFIGSHLCESLLRQGEGVAVIDDLNDFYDPALKRQNLNRIVERGGMFYPADLRHKRAIFQVFRQERPDVVVHLGARAGIRPSLLQPELYVSTNVLGTLNVLEAMREHGVPKLVFASSSSVYGNRSRVPFSESDPVGQPVSPYAATKLAGEQLVHTYSHLYGIGAVCLRLFTVYGPRQRPDLAIHKFYTLMLERKPVPLYGDGTTSRDYTYVSDVIRGIRASIQLRARFEIINLGGGSPVLACDLIRAIAKVLGVSPALEMLPPQPGDVDRTCADVAKAKSLLGFAPEVSLMSGLALFHKWYREECSPPRPFLALPVPVESPIEGLSA
ncbi:MAG: NAD-dependent epimerase/dehydratase family protein [Bryobacteraceae bacterium]